MSDYLSQLREQAQALQSKSYAIADLIRKRETLTETLDALRARRPEVNCEQVTLSLPPKDHSYNVMKRGKEITVTQSWAQRYTLDLRPRPELLEMFILLAISDCERDLEDVNTALEELIPQ